MSGPKFTRPATQNTMAFGDFTGNEPELSQPTEASEISGETVPVEETNDVPEGSETSSEQILGGVVTEVAHTHQISKFADEQPAVRYITNARAREDANRLMIQSSITDLKLHAQASVQTEKVDIGHSVQDVASRVVELGHVTWLTTTVSMADALQPYNASTPETLMNATIPTSLIKGGIKNSTMIYEKVNGFSAMRCNAVVRLLINAQPFQAGIVKIVAFPYPVNMANRFQIAMQNGVSIDQLPSAEVDISKHRSVDLKLQWSGPAILYDLPTGSPQMWEVMVIPKSPLCDSTGQGVRLTLYGFFEDLQVFHPTALPAADVPSPVVRTRRVMKTSDEGQLMANSGTISGPATTISNIASTLAMVPGVGQFAAPIAAVSSGVAGIARAMGHSRPENPSVVQPVIIKQGGEIFTGDGCEASHPLSVTTINAVNNNEHTPSGSDELHLNYIIGKKTLINKFPWAVADEEDTLLYNALNLPSYMQNVDETQNLFTSTPLAFVANQFAYWRGSIRFTFKVVKTKFHSGVLRIGHLMFGQTDSQLTNFDINRTPTVIWNIDNSSTYEYIVPFGNIMQWRRTARPVDLVNNATLSQEYVSAIVFVSVANPLVAASTVPSTVQILVEVSGCDDMQFAVPLGPKFKAAIGFPAPTAAKSKRVMKIGTAPESLTRRGGGVQRTGLGTTTHRSILAEETTIGETLVSFRPLLKRFVPWASGDIKSTETDPGTITSQAMVIQPNPRATCDNYAVPDENNGEFLDWIEMISNLYAYRTGGVYLKMYPRLLTGGEGSTGNYTTPNFLYVFPIPAMSQTTSSELQADTNVTSGPVVEVLSSDPGNVFALLDQERAGVIPIYVRNEGIATVNVPYYARYHLSLNESYDLQEDKEITDTSTEKFQAPSMKLYVLPDYNSDVRLNILRAARDDFNFSGFLGVPGVMRYFVDAGTGGYASIKKVTPTEGKLNNPTNFPRSQIGDTVAKLVGQRLEERRRRYFGQTTQDSADGIPTSIDL
jgi:hypothetical protein